MYREILNPGTHKVVISRIFYGNSRNKGTPYFKCCFENEEGYIPKILYVTESSKPYIKKLFDAVGIDKEEVETAELEGKELLIDVQEFPKVDFQTGEVIGKFNECVKFRSSDDVNNEIKSKDLPF